ncbi:DUF3800 domain-containing protein [Polaribacter sp. IC073]|uniref:DUF3800 domain-containing protein n=1 Tax=Polaribacter sp. IC073 TaxID=2508540 RepID=UPI0011BF32CB|nr:DUF3800 domain-containing protein [Polaribacter sp. IC073]TXD48039.1 hypothetical protein ES045_09440 [Polaribacter sp. IC073]
MDRGVIFSDESGQDNDNRYGAICTVSGYRKNLISLHQCLETIMTDYSKSEIKFKDVKGGLKLKIAKEFVVQGLNEIDSKNIKIHVLVWDKQDARHNIQNRCDIQNLKRMYYKILKEVKKDWSYINDWSFYPDEFTAINWQDDIVKYVEKTKLFNNSELFDAVSQFKFPNYQKAVEKDSKLMYNIQLTDLFAGIVRGSRLNSKEYIQYLENQKNQISLFKENSISISSNLKPKLELMHYFKEESSKRKLGVGFKENNYFETFNKKNNIFIWHYKAKSEYDKAPIKVKKT